MFKNSITIKLLKKLPSLFSVLFVAFKNSFLYKSVCFLSDCIADLYSKSLSHKLFTGKDIEESASSSRFYRAFSWITSKITSLSSNIFSFLSSVYNGSGIFHVAQVVKTVWLNSKLGSFVRRHTDPYMFFFGIVVAAVFCVPHDFWNNFFGLAAALFSAVWVLYGFWKNKKTVNLNPEKTYLSLLLFFACLILSTIFSRSQGDSIRVLIFFVTSIIFCLTVSAFTSHKTSYRSFCGTIFLCVIVTASIGLYQSFVGVATDASLTDLTLNADMPGRIFSTMGNANNFAQMLVLFMPYCAAFALTSGTKKKRIIYCALLALPFVALLQTYSRSGWIAFAVAVAVFVAMSNRRVIPALILVCIVAIPFLPETVLNRILTIGNMQDSSSSYRILIWEGARDLLAMCWTTGLGIGPGAFKSVYHAFAIGGTQNVAHCHMQFMEIFLETGVLGFSCFLWMTASLIRRALIATSSKNKETKYFAAAAAASMTSIIFIGFFEYYWFYPRVMFAFFISAGLAIGIHKVWQSEKESNKENENV